MRCLPPQPALASRLPSRRLATTRTSAPRRRTQPHRQLPTTQPARCRQQPPPIRLRRFRDNRRRRHATAIGSASKSTPKSAGTIVLDDGEIESAGSRLTVAESGCQRRRRRVGRPTGRRRDLHHAAALGAGMDLADRLGATDFQPRAARFTDDAEWFHDGRSNYCERSLSANTFSHAPITLLLPLSYHARGRPILRLFRAKGRRQLVVPLGRPGSRGHDDLFGFIGLFAR